MKDATEQLVQTACNLAEQAIALREFASRATEATDALCGVMSGPCVTVFEPIAPILRDAHRQLCIAGNSLKRLADAIEGV